MSYATVEQLTDRYGAAMLIELTDRADPPAGAIDADVVDRALADADALIDGYLMGRYALPLAATPPLVTDLALALAIYKLHRNIASEKIRTDYEDARKTLDRIASGAVRLDIAGVEPATNAASQVRTNDRERDLTPCNLRGFI